MNAPFLWIGLPAISAGILFIIRRQVNVVRSIGIIMSLVLALLAWKFPIATDVSIGWLPIIPTINISDSFTILGRQFIITNATRLTMLLIYLNAALWFIGSITVPVSRAFIPFGLGISATLASAISVSPFIYSALIIEIAVLLSIPLLSPPGRQASRGVRRFLIFQTIGMSILVFSGWIVDQVALNPTNEAFAQLASIFLGLGFAVIISLFPFSTWIPMIAEKTNPYMAAFIFFTLPQTIALYAILTIRQFTWLSNNPTVLIFFQIIGITMIIGAGVWSIFQNNLGRIFGYAIIMEIGATIITLGLILDNARSTGLEATETIAPIVILFYVLLVPRGLNQAIWALSLLIIRSETLSLDYQEIKGIARKYPIAIASICLACFSLAGLPMTAGYPLKVIIGSSLATGFPSGQTLFIIGSIGIILSILRSLYFIIPSEPQINWKVNETRPQIALLTLGLVLLLVVGFFPQVFFNLYSFFIP